MAFYLESLATAHGLLLLALCLGVSTGGTEGHIHARDYTLVRQIEDEFIILSTISGLL